MDIRLPVDQAEKLAEKLAKDLCKFADESGIPIHSLAFTLTVQTDESEHSVIGRTRMRGCGESLGASVARLAAELPKDEIPNFLHEFVGLMKNHPNVQVVDTSNQKAEPKPFRYDA